MGQTSPRSVLVYRLSAFLLVLAACGGDETTSSTAPVDTTAPTSDPTSSDTDTDPTETPSDTDTPSSGDTSATGDTSDTGTPVDTRPRLLDSCEVTLPLDHGTLCVLRPSVLDPGARDEAGTSVLDARIGYGWHVVAIPDEPRADHPMWVHIGGSYGRPYDQDNGNVRGGLWMDELMAEGFLVLQPAYDNRFAVNDSCSPNQPGFEEDNCAGNVREEVLTGDDLTDLRETPLQDAMEHRMAVLTQHLAAHQGVTLPAALDPAAPDWSLLSVSGHSQGGNLAYYIARFRGVVFGCMLAAPYDYHDAVDPSFPFIADWFTEGTPLTPVEQLGQLITTEDDAADAFRSAGALIGLEAGVQAFEVSAPPYTNVTGEELDGHAAALSDPDLAADRAAACLR